MHRPNLKLGASFLALGLGLAAGAGLVSATDSRAQSIVSTGESFVTPSLVVGTRQADGARELGLVLDMAPGWKTYWRKPGEAGIPPSFDWSGSTNVAAVAIDWPRPQSFMSFGLHTLGYEKRVVLPLSVLPEDPSRPMSLRLEVALGVCDDICVLEQATVARGIDPAEAGGGAATIAAARALVPGDGVSDGLLGATCRIRGAGAERAFEAEITFSAPVDAPVVVLEGPEETWFHDTAVASDGGRIGVTSRLSTVDPAQWIGRNDVRITVLAGALAADIKGCAAPAG